MSEEQQEQQSGEQAVVSSAAEGSAQAEHKPPRKPREPSVNETAMLIADALGETEEGPREQLVHIVWALGRTQARALLERTREIEAGEGLLVPDGSRRRTPGGVYFYLAYTEGKPKPGKRLRRSFAKKTPDKAAASDNATEKQSVAAPLPVVPFTWGDRIAAIRESEEMKGTANVKMTVVGRPGKIVERGNCIVTVMESTKVPALPKGLPAPAATPTKYTVYIAAKQWRKVEQAIADPEDVLIVEGFPTMDAEARAIAVFATNTTTKKLQQALKEAQKAKGQETAV